MVTEILGAKIWGHLRRFAVAVAVGGVAVAPSVHAHAPGELLIVPSAEIPEPARQGGESIFLRNTRDGRALLYIEHQPGAAGTVLDVTDPGHIKMDRTAKIGADEAQSPGIPDIDSVGYANGRDCQTGDLGRAFQGKNIRNEVTNCTTGTTFLLTDNGLSIVRRPAVEQDRRERDETWFWQHNGD
jgi:hypothetical protein